MNNGEKILSILETLVVKVGNLEQGQAELSGKVETLSDKVETLSGKVDKLEQEVKEVKQDLKIVKEDVHYLRRASDEAFKDIYMLDKRTRPLRTVK